MPLDAIALAGVMTAPAVAGIVAVTIHRQRLDHERRESDLRQVREILVSANGASYGFVVELQHMHAKERPTDARIAALADANRLSHQFFESLLQLRLLFEPDEPLLTATEALVERFDAILRPCWDVEPRGWPDPDLRALEREVDSWFNEARAVARARLT